jgi:hypothetical protein
MQGAATNRAMEPTKVGSPSLGFILTHALAFWQDGIATNFEACGRNLTIRLVLTPSQGVAVLCQGDFIRRVGRAYRMSATNRPEHAFPRLSGTSAGVIRQQGLHSSCGECQNTAPHGARFLTDVGRTYGLKVSKVSSSLARRPEKQRLPKDTGNTVWESYARY